MNLSQIKQLLEEFNSYQKTDVSTFKKDCVNFLSLNNFSILEELLEKLMTKAKVKSINKENNTITISLFTIQDVLSLSVFNYDLFLKFLNENDLNEMIYLCEDFYSTYIIKLYASDYIFILKSLFSKLILKSVETKTFKERNN